MKLNDYFQTQKNTILTDVDKLELYQKFLYKKDLSSPIKRFSFVHAKAFIYIIILGFFFIGLYGVYIFNDGSSWTNSNTVQADYIAKVVSFNGDFFIEHQGNISHNENISDGDTIILKQGSEMVFEINMGTKSKIIGPAKLTIQKVNDNDTKYKLNLIYGDYIQMEGSQTPQSVELAIDDILIKQGDNSTPINFQFINEGKGHILKNNGASLIITKNGNQKPTQLAKKQVLAIEDHDITLFKNRDNFAQAIKKGEVSQTFTLNEAKYTTVETTVTDVASSGTNNDEMPVSLMALLATDEIKTTDIEKDDVEKISSDISLLMGEGKQILTPEQNSNLRGTLGATFLMDDMQEAYTNNNQAKITSIVNQLYSSFDTKPNSTTSTAENIAELINILSTKYEVPPKYIANLRALSNWIPIIAGTKDKTREEFSTSLPSNIQFQ